jgi:hypothetical protein
LFSIVLLAIPLSSLFSIVSKPSIVLPIVLHSFSCFGKLHSHTPLFFHCSYYITGFCMPIVLSFRKGLSILGSPLFLEYKRDQSRLRTSVFLLDYSPRIHLVVNTSR